MVSETGLEPAPHAPNARALPTELLTEKMVCVNGFEPLISCFRGKWSNQTLLYAVINKLLQLCVILTPYMKTLKLRLKDKHASVLIAMAKEVNTVWNFCNETSHKAIVERKKFLTSYDLDKLTAGYTKIDGVKINSRVMQSVSVEYVSRRKQFKKNKLAWRVSNGKASKRSLGWIPFKVDTIVYKSGQVKFAGYKFSLWDSYGLSQYKFRSGSFNQDARGRWYLNIAVEIEPFVGPQPQKSQIGIDLGLKSAVTCSDGKVLIGRNYRKYEKAIALSQRARTKKKTRNIHAKIKNTRKDELHKLSNELVRKNSMIFVGNVNGSKLAKTKMAKSTYDAGWYMFKTMLEYKCNYAGAVFEVVDESYTTQTCSTCLRLSGPQNLKGLGMREWICCGCQSVHDRDINSAQNILAVGLGRLAEGIAV